MSRPPPLTDTLVDDLERAENEEAALQKLHALLEHIQVRPPLYSQAQSPRVGRKKWAQQAS